MANKRAPLAPPEHVAEWRIDLNDGRGHLEVPASQSGVVGVPFLRESVAGVAVVSAVAEVVPQVCW